MIEESTFRVVNNKVQVFGGDATIPPGDYPGGIDYYVVNSERTPFTALIKVDRAVLEAQGMQLVPNKPKIDFEVLAHIERGNIEVV